MIFDTPKHRKIRAIEQDILAIIGQSPENARQILAEKYPDFNWTWNPSFSGGAIYQDIDLATGVPFPTNTPDSFFEEGAFVSYQVNGGMLFILPK
ncbi:MAG: hypothetical protein V4576_03820 [Patescibacteria group bacterium]